MARGFPKLAMQRPKTVQQAVTEAIRDMILEGHLAPGDRIDQDRIAGLLGVSRTPIRESLRILEAEGMVSMYPHQGAIVAELSPAELEDIFSIRATLESMAGRHAVESLTQDDLARLGDLQQRMTTAHDHDEWMDLNEAFHTTIYAAAGRPRLFDLITSLRHTVRPYIRLYISWPDHRRVADSQHEQILRASAACDRHELGEVLACHLQTTCRHVSAPMREQSG